VLSLILVGTAVFIVCNEGLLNLEALAWCALTVLLALPGIAAWRGIFRDSGRAPSAHRVAVKAA
jgi:hypothetical protein